MTDTEGTEARRSDGEETQFIQPIRDYGRAETKPLDLPRATIGGYRADAVERRVAELERRRTLDQAEIIRLKRENHARQTENGELNQRLTMLREQNKKLEYQASNPYEHIGVDMQNMVNGAKAERKAILDKAETEARTMLGKARAKAETLTAEEKRSLYQGVAESQLAAWSKGSGFYYWNYKLLTDTMVGVAVTDAALHEKTADFDFFDYEADETKPVD